MGGRRDGRRPPWAIGMLAGPDPLRLAPLADAPQPVLAARHVRDVPAAFVADPFLVHHDGRWHLFFEVMNADGRGTIGHATSDDGRAWRYDRIVLRERFHLSYPQVFTHAGTHWMLPETLGLRAAVLYRAAPFPWRWVRHAVLVRGVLADPTIFRAGGWWWLLGCPRPAAHDRLELHLAPDLEGPWRPHPASPIVRADPRAARPAGVPIVAGGRLLRLAQDCMPAYGSAVRAFEILALDPERYAEREHAASPLLAPSHAGWPVTRTHHLHAHPHPDGGWLACMDGVSAPSEDGEPACAS